MTITRLLLAQLVVGFGGAMASEDPEQDPTSGADSARQAASGKEEVAGDSQRVERVRGIAEEAAGMLRPAHRGSVMVDAVEAIYANLEYRLRWSRIDSSEKFLQPLLAVLVEHGYPSDSAPVVSADETLAGKARGDGDALEEDVLRTAVFVHFALVLRDGILPTERFWDQWDRGDTPGRDEDRKRREGLWTSISEGPGQDGDPAQLLRRFVPRNHLYDRLHKAWREARQEAEAAEEDWVVLEGVEGNRAVSAGEAYPALATLEDRLARWGYWESRMTDRPDVERSTDDDSNVRKEAEAEEENNTVAEPEFTEAHAESLKRFQRDHGLAADGILGPDTLGVLNETPMRAVRRLRANLERARWLPDLLGERCLLINIPQGHLFGFDRQKSETEPAISMRVVYGSSQPERRTPVFRDRMERVVFRPYWNIPKSIARKEIIPKAREDWDYLERRGYEIVSSYGPGAKVHEVSSANLAAVAKGRLKLRQRAGSENALGLVKFLFPNQNSVYLHDTPKDELFARSERDFSHGCIRVERPADLAAFVLGGKDWSSEEISAAMNGPRRQVVALEEPIPVYVVYLTNSIGGSDRPVVPLHDVYQRDAAILEALTELDVLETTGDPVASESDGEEASASSQADSTP